MKSQKLMNFVLAALGFLFIVSFSVVLVLNFRPLYYYDMKAMDLAGTYDMSEEEIRENYDALISYNSIFNREELSFPTLPMSESAKIHFEEVKRIFVAIQFLLLLSAVLFFPLAFYAVRKEQNPAFLKWIPILTGLVGALVLVLALADWEGFFVAFHHLMFRNDYWLFDPATDPIINLLPDLFFFHCLAGIVAVMVLLLLLCLFLYRRFKKSYGIRP